MGKVMTGRQAYGEYDAASDKQSEHHDDPLAELARIVSEGDEFLRQQRSEAESPADTHFGSPSGQAPSTDDREAPPSDTLSFAPDSREAESPAHQTGIEQAPALDSAFGAGTPAADPYVPPEPVSPAYTEPDPYQRVETGSEFGAQATGGIAPDPYGAPDPGYAAQNPEAGDTEPRVQIHLDPQELVDPSYESAGAPGSEQLQVPSEPGFADEYSEAAAWPQEGPYGLEQQDHAALTAGEPAYGYADETGQTAEAPGDLGFGVGNTGDFGAVGAAGQHGADGATEADGRASRNLGIKAIAAVVALILVGGGGLYAYRLIGGSGVSGEPQLIKADTEPFKKKAVDTANNTAQNAPGAGVYKRLSGSPQSDKSQERIVVGKEQPVNVARNGGQSGANVSRSTLPKPVKTIVVKPDGTFVSRPDPKSQTDTAASSAPAKQPVTDTSGTGANSEEPAVQTKSAARVVSTSPIRSVTASKPAAADAGKQETASVQPTVTVPAQTQPGATGITEAPVSPAASSPNQVQQGDTAVGQGTSETAAVRAETILVTPRAKPARPAGANQTRTFASNQQPASQNTAAPARTTAPAAPAASAQTVRNGGYIVQVSSQRSQRQALAAYSDLQRRYPSLLENREPLIQKADLGDRGIYYRVRLGPYERQAANQLCGQLASAGGECFVRRN